MEKTGRLTSDGPVLKTHRLEIDLLKQVMDRGLQLRDVVVIGFAGCQVLQEIWKPV